MAEITPDQSTENYLQLLNTHEKALAAYVHTLVNDRHDAEDIIQSCKLTMWKQFARFLPIRTDHTVINMVAIQVVLIPPAVDPGEPPINIRTFVTSLLGDVIAA